jgi:branched-chain amino acid transport system ATP-binding protein
MILEVENLSKSFGGIKAVDRVGFRVRKGEFSSIIGPNGAGKSTLFHLLTGLVKKDSGRVRFKGEDISDLPPYKICLKGVGRSFQLVNLFQRMSVFDNIQTAIIAGRGKSLGFIKPAAAMMREDAEGIIEGIGLFDKRKALAADLSHGEQRRLELGIALSNSPELVFLDEPCAGLTVEETKTMVNLILKLAKERELTVILVEHKMGVVFSVSEIIRVLHEGRLIFEGTPDEVKRSDEVLKVYLGEEGEHGGDSQSRRY